MTTPRPQKSRRPLEILVLDDDHNWRHQLALHLELNLGIRPIITSNGREALEIMAKTPIDVVVSDLFMPEMDGFQFMKRARILFPETKVLLMSGDFGAFPISPYLMIEQGAFATIPKTQVASTLQDLLRRLQEENGEPAGL